MKVVHLALACFYVEGMEYQENVLPRKHKQLGHDTYVITSRYAFDEKYKRYEVDTGEYTNKDGIEVTVLPYKYDNLGKYGKKYSRKYRLYTGLYKKLNEIKPDVIFSHGVQFYTLYELIRYVRQHKNTKLFVDSHSDYCNSPLNTKQRFRKYRYLWGRQFRRIEKYADKIWCTLPSRVTFMNEVYNVTSDKVDLLVMGGDVERLNEEQLSAIRKSVKSKYNIDENTFLIVTGGKIDKAKNIHLVMQAMKKLGNKNAHLIVFGKPVEAMKDEIKSLSEAGNITNIGWLTPSECYDLFYAADLAVFPGTHSVLWEQACACSLPAIFKNTKGQTHIDLGGNCILLNEVSVDEIYTAINKLLENKALYNSMKNIAVEKGYDAFSYEAIAKKAIQI